jgi:hypothetical protein
MFRRGGNLVWRWPRTASWLQCDAGMRKLACMTRAALVVPVLVLVSGCGDRCKQAYDAGYKAGLAAGTLNATKAAKGTDAFAPEMEASAAAQPNWTSGPVFTEVCGGAGVDVGSSHIEPGESGCVRVFSDGRIERY